MATAAVLLSSPPHPFAMEVENPFINKRKRRSEDDEDSRGKRVQLGEISSNLITSQLWPYGPYNSRPIAQPKRQFSNPHTTTIQGPVLQVQQPIIPLATTSDHIEQSFEGDLTSTQMIMQSAELSYGSGMMTSAGAASHAMTNINAILVLIPSKLGANANWQSKMNALTAIMQIANLIYECRSYPFGWDIRGASRTADSIAVFNKALVAVLKNMNARTAWGTIQTIEIRGESLYNHMVAMSRLEEWERSFGVEQRTMKEVARFTYVDSMIVDVDVEMDACFI